MSARALACGAILAALAATPLRAQRALPGLPTYQMLSPVAMSRSGLYFQPYVEPSPGWRTELVVDYASMTEVNSTDTREVYVLDAEGYRAQLRLSRDVGPRSFLLAEASVLGVYGGVLDGFLTWYHDLFGLPTPERQRFRGGTFDYFLFPAPFAAAEPFRFRRASAMLGDVRLAAGHRVLDGLQAVGTVTLPTNTGPEGYGRRTVSASVLATGRARPHPRVVLEGALGAGWTPGAGTLAPFQRTVFANGSVGGRWRFAGAVSAYANVLYHSGLYRFTGLPSLELPEWTVDFGFLVTPRGWPELTLGMTEDLAPDGAAIDVVFRLGARWR